MATYTVQDRDHEIQFDGELLAEISSRTDDKKRWIELRLFRTVGGSYVLAGTGMSIVDGESNRRWAEISDEPEGVIEFLYLPHNTTQRLLPQHATALLQE